MNTPTRNIQITDLPPRARGLTDDQLSNVFGGCGIDGSICQRGKDCCSEHCKRYAVYGGGYWSFCVR